MRWGAVPWPDDLYLEHGHLAVTSLPFESDELRDAVSDALATVDGAGARPTMVVMFDGELDRESLPESAAASLAPEATVFLIDADASSPDAFERLPLDVRLARDRRSIRARVAFDRALTPGRRYVLVVTDGLRGRSQRRVAPSLQLERILDSSVPLADAREKRARAQYLPILPALQDDGIGRSRVVALSSFRVQSVERDLDEARALFEPEDMAAAPRLSAVVMGEPLDEALGEAPDDVIGAKPGTGVPHQHIAALAHLTVRTPMFAVVEPGERAPFERDASGVLLRRGQHDVPCTLIVPRSLSGSAVPVILFQHGLFGERSDALPVANELAATGYAVLACDAPLHGSRLPGSDEGNRFTGAPEPDGFGDLIGDVLGRKSGAGVLRAAHPFYYRDVVQQAVIDWLAIIASLRSGTWDDPLREALASEDVTIEPDTLGFIGVDVGAEIGVAVSAREAAITVAVLAFAGGRTIDDWRQGPDYAPFREAYEDLLEHDDEQGFPPEFRADTSAVRMLLDPASGLAHAGFLRRSNTNLLLYIADDDELVPRASSEALAFGLGATLVDATPQFELELRRVIAVPSVALTGNFPLSRGAVTRVAQGLSRATHTTLFTSAGQIHFEHPLEAEPVPLGTERTVTNPTEAVMRQIAFFFESHRACRALQTEPLVPCPADVGALSDER